MFLKSVDLNLVLLPLLVVGVVVVLVVRQQIYKRPLSPIEKAFEVFKLMAVVLGVILAVLWLALPSTPSLGTFGRPEEIRSLTDVLSYLQEYNEALVRTVQVMHWFLFLFIFWFFSMLFEFFKAVAGKRAQPEFVSSQY